MKVHRYQIEVMWLILAVLSGWISTLTRKRKLEPQPARQDPVREQRYSPYQIRPPPLTDWIFTGFLTSERTQIVNQWAIPPGRPFFLGDTRYSHQAVVDGDGFFY